MGLQHRSHDHSLILNEAQKGDSHFLDFCYGCGKGISDPVYNCSQQCSFHLHKICAELPEKNEHPTHPQHPLILYIKAPHGSQVCQCHVCENLCDKFTYHCTDCKFNLCISCVLEEERLIEHKSHKHPSVLVQRPASFHCDACDEKSTDTSYLCTTCPFWIHKSCASLQSTIKRNDHDHPLTLAYSLPVEYSKFSYSCEICPRKVRPTHWVYYCGRCRFFAHVECAPSKTETVRLRGSKSETKAKEDLDPNLINLPLLPDKYVELISHFSKKFNLGENPSVTEVNHFSHDHTLILSEVQSNKDVKNDEILCNGCVEPMSAPFYSCAQCSFYLHKCCVQLPETVQHPFHQRHQLYLRGQGPDNFYYFKCNNCNKLCNGFSFNCAGCYFSLDVTCASLSDTIKHEAHEHQLIHIRSPYCLCNACGECLSGLALACKICGFYISNHCAMLPHTARHRSHEHSHEHPLYLSYPPFDDHPNKFYCEICEKEIDPKLWLYRCRDCPLSSFHTRCISPVEDYPNFKFGKTFKARDHPHHLTVVRETMEDSKCDGCSEYFDDKPAFEPAFKCETCNTMVCRRCTLYADF